MKGLILYRSFFGNTREVAEHMAKTAATLGHEVAAVDLQEKLPDFLAFDFVIVGAPTRMAGVTGKATGALKQLHKKGFKKPVAIFDLYGPIPSDPMEYEKGKHWLYPGAIGKMLNEAKKQDLNLYPETLRIEVKELKGPLVAGELDKAAAWVRGFIAWAVNR